MIVVALFFAERLSNLSNDSPVKHNDKSQLLLNATFKPCQNEIIYYRRDHYIIMGHINVYCGKLQGLSRCLDYQTTLDKVNIDGHLQVSDPETDLKI